MRFLFIAIVGVFAATAAQAQQSGQTCTVSDFILSSSTPGEAVTKIRGKCQVGDTVFIELANPFVIASICDLTKSTVTTPRHVYCMIAPPKPQRQ